MPKLIKALLINEKPLWSDEEDNRLRLALKLKYSHKKSYKGKDKICWLAVAESVITRTAEECKVRYANRFDSTRSHASLNHEQEQEILRLLSYRQSVGKVAKQVGVPPLSVTAFSFITAMNRKQFEHAGLEAIEYIDYSDSDEDDELQSDLSSNYSDEEDELQSDLSSSQSSQIRL